MSVEMRASDDDRQKVVAELERHTAADRLTLEEFAERVGAAYTARTLADLARVVTDLPAEPPAPPPSTADSGGRQLIYAFAAALVVLIILGLIMVLLH